MFKKESKFLLIKIISPRVHPKNTYWGHYTPFTPIRPLACSGRVRQPFSLPQCRGYLVNQMVDIRRTQS